jgi:TolA-binding protein
MLSQMAAGNQADAQAEVNNIEANFQSHPDFPWYIYSVANQYEELKKDDEAKAIYQRILQQYPDSPVAGGARLHFSRYNVSSLLASGNDTAAQSEIDGIATDLPGHPDLQWYFSNIANQYEELGKHSEADRVKSLYQQITQNHPNGLSAGKAGLQYSRAEVLFLAVSQKDDEAKAAFDKLIADFSDHPDLLDTLYWIAQNYEGLGRYEESKSIYQQIIQNYPDSSLIWHAQFLAGRINQDLAKAGVISQADADAKTKAAYQQLLEKYPDCKAAKAAQSWLNRNTK